MILVEIASGMFTHLPWWMAIPCALPLAALFFRS